MPRRSLAAPDPVIEAKQTKLVSPTGVTNALRRPAEKGGFLAAEHFHTAYASQDVPPQVTPTNSPLRRRRDQMGSFEAGANTTVSTSALRHTRRTFGCAPYVRGGGGGGGALSEVKPKTSVGHQRFGSAFTTPQSLQNGARQIVCATKPHPMSRQSSDVKLYSPRSHPRTPRQRPQKQSSQQSQIQSCVTMTQRKHQQARACTTDTYKHYKDECKVEVRGEHRGDDSAFFVAVDKNEMENSGSTSSMTSFGENTALNRSGRSGVSGNPEDSFRKRAMRFPAAALVTNPLDDDPSILEQYEEASSHLESIPIDAAAGNTPTDLRDFRLQLFQRDKNEKVVPSARLSRALNELVIQDGQIGDLEVELEEAQHDLNTSREQLKRSEEETKDQRDTVTALRANLARQKLVLGQKLQRETDENAKLQAKIAMLQLETTKLKNALKSSKTELNRTTKLWLNAKKQVGDDEASLSTRRSAVTTEDAEIKALRDEIARLKKRLADAEMRHAPNNPGRRGGAMPRSNPKEMIELRQRLRLAGEQLKVMKEAERKKGLRTVEIEKKLKDSLQQARQELVASKNQQEVLRKEIELTRRQMRSTEQSKKSEQMGSLLEVEDLRKQLKQAKEEAAVAQEKALKDLEECRRESEELKAEVKKLSTKLQEATNEAASEAAARIRQANDYSMKLRESQQSEKSLKEKVDDLLQKVEQMDVSNRGSDLEGPTPAERLGILPLSASPSSKRFTPFQTKILNNPTFLKVHRKAMSKDDKNSEKLEPQVSSRIGELREQLKEARQRVQTEQANAEEALRKAKSDEAKRTEELLALQEKLDHMNSHTSDAKLRNEVTELRSRLKEAEAEMERVRMESSEKANVPEELMMRTVTPTAVDMASEAATGSEANQENRAAQPEQIEAAESTSLSEEEANDDGDTLETSTRDPPETVRTEQKGTCLDTSMSAISGSDFTTSASEHTDRNRFDMQDFRERLKESSARLTEARTNMKNLVGIGEESDTGTSRDIIDADTSKEESIFAGLSESTLDTISEDVPVTSSLSSPPRKKKNFALERYRKVIASQSPPRERHDTREAVIRLQPSSDWSEERSI